MSSAQRRRRGAAALTTISLHASVAQAGGATINVPATILAGDLAILFDQARGSSATLVTPSGFTDIPSGGAFNSNAGGAIPGRAAVSYKILASSDASATLTGMNESADEDKVLLIFRGNVPIKSVTPSGWTANLTGNDPAASAVDTTGYATPMLAFCKAGAQGNASFTPSPSATGTANSTGNETYVAYYEYDSGDAVNVNHTCDIGDVGANCNTAAGALLLT